MAAKVSPLCPVRIAGKGYRRRDLAPLYAVTSGSDASRVWIVVWEAARSEWVCGCPHFTFRRTCKHATVVKARLAEERTRRLQPVQATDAAGEETRWAITPAGRVALAQYESERERRETSMRRGPQAFSILK